MTIKEDKEERERERERDRVDLASTIERVCVSHHHANIIIHINNNNEQLERFLQANEERFLQGITPEADSEDNAGEAETMPWR